MSPALHISFLHANGYPSGVYRQFFSALREHATVDAPALLDTAPDCPAHRRWPQMLDQVVNTLTASLAVRKRGGTSARRPVLVGHSMGGYIALQAAARHVDLIRDVVLIDSPIPTGWRANLLSFTQVTGLAYRAGPAPIAARRRDHWPSREAAREYFLGKAFVHRWADGVLDDFIEHALVATGDGVTLRVPRDTERDIYAHVAHRSALRALRRLQRNGVRVSYVCGEQSEETRMAGLEANARLFAPNFYRMDCGHLIPQEQPRACAEMVLHALRA